MDQQKLDLFDRLFQKDRYDVYEFVYILMLLKLHNHMSMDLAINPVRHKNMKPVVHEI